MQIATLAVAELDLKYSSSSYQVLPSVTTDDRIGLQSLCRTKILLSFFQTIQKVLRVEFWL